MTDQTLTEIVCILDKSGSMQSLTSDTVGTFNNFIAEQRAVPGKARVSLVLFNTHVDPVYLCSPLPEVPPLTTLVYHPTGGTALLDAVGQTITDVGARLRGTPEAQRPGKVLFMIITDGAENSSMRFKRDQVKAMIEHQKERYGWQFLYLGADVNAFEEAASIGILRGQTLAYNATSKGVGVMGQHVNSFVSSYRGMVDTSTANQMDWSNEARLANDPTQAPVAGTITTTKP